jgi:hypothetical protein
MINLRDFKVVPKLVEAINSGKPEAFYTALKYEILRQKEEKIIKDLEQEYKSKYMNPAGFYKESYAIYTTIDNQGRKVYKLDCYKKPKSIEDIKKPLAERELKDECKKLIEAGKSIPTLELYINLTLPSRIAKLLNEDVTKEEMIEYGKEAFDKITTMIADKYHKKAEELVAQKSEVTLYQKERYNTKLSLAKKYLETGDEKAKELLSIGASKMGIDVDTYANNIVQAAEAWNSALEKYETLIDEYRVAVKSIFFKDPMAAINILIEANEVMENPSVETINNIFNKYAGV